MGEGKGMEVRMVRAIGSVIAWLACVLALTPVAFGGTYDVNACATPAGKFTNHSWAIGVNGSFAPVDCRATDARPQVALTATADQLYDAGQAATLTFSAPAGTTIANFRLHRQLFQFNPVDGSPGRAMLYSLVQLGGTPVEGGGSYDGQVTSTLGSYGNWYGGGGAYDTGDGIVTKDSFRALLGYGGSAGFLRVTIGCHATPCALKTNGNNIAGSIFAALFGATVTINDPTTPKVDRVYPTGLDAGGAVGGGEPLTFDASDNSGIQRAELVDVTPGADSKVVGTKAFGCDYSYAAPCPQAAAAEITATDLGPGQKTLVLRLTDAAGNLGQSAPFAVQAEGPLNGTSASAAAKLTASFARNRRGRLTVNYGGKATVRGRVTDATGAPIAGATVQVRDRELRIGTRYVQRAEVTTGADGRFTVGLVPGAARAFRLEYRTRRFSAKPAASRTVSLRVRAGVTLHVSPHRVRAGGTIRLSGRLKGLPLPKSGKIVDLQAYDAGRWRTFDTVRARRGARYAARYHFLRARPGRTFQFRARVRRDDSYAYYLGYSPRARVRLG